MERESFEDSEVADYLNKYYIAIKVDKEERPDVDSIYMSVCQSLNGSGGWPLTIFMLPNQKPFFAGTYFPKTSKYNRPGLLTLLEAVQERWNSNKDELIQSADSITTILEEENSQSHMQKSLSEELTQNATHSLVYHFDKEYGGFGTAPKFPTPHNLMYLLRVSYYKDKQTVIPLVEKTLDSMYQGGMFDHIGYGFSRYSTDQMWLVPHFEKMLYDNALLIMAYLEAYQITKKDHYRQIAEMTMEYVLRELTNEQGGFYCAQDADSEGVEGKYYVFTPEEIIKVLGEEDGTYFNHYYGITKEGNFEGKNIPNRIPKRGTAIWNELKSLGRNEDNKELNNLENERISQLRKKIYDYRLQRTRLHKDDKVLTSWNGIMIAAFSKAYQILQEDKYLEAARRADQFLRDKLSKGNRLAVHYRDGVVIGIGHLDDYAFYIWALIELYQATFEVDYLTRAIMYTKVLIEQFYDTEHGGFYLNAKEGENLIHRPKELYDGAIPSGNSVASYVLLKLASLTGDQEILNIMDQQMNYVASNISDYPSGHSYFMMVALQVLHPSKELICVVQNKQDIKRIQQLFAEHFLPGVTVLIKDSTNVSQLEQLAPFTKEYQMKDSVTTYYLCQNQACMSPFHEFEKLEELLIKNK